MDKWADTFHCTSRAHCDYCLGSAEWHKLVSEYMIMPKFGTCPYGETLSAGKERRADVIVARVAAGVLTAEQAETVATKLGLELDVQPVVRR